LVRMDVSKPFPKHFFKFVLCRFLCMEF